MTLHPTTKDEMYAIILKDDLGLYTWYRDTKSYNAATFYKEAGSSAEVVKICKGSLEDIREEAKEFERENKRTYKQLKTLPHRDISYLLGEGIVGLQAKGPSNVEYLKRHNLMDKIKVTK
jgi:hypothetical protein